MPAPFQTNFTRDIFHKYNDTLKVREKYGFLTFLPTPATSKTSF